MKTLDEVIKAFEICDETVTANCPDCPYDIDCENVPGEGLRTDALHYLKEYRNKEMFYNQSVDHMVLMMNEHEDRVAMYLAEMHKNNPLTWSELKQMEGKPIWLEYNFQIGDKEFRDKSKRWCIIGEFKPWHDTEITITENGFVLSKNEQVKCWQAYRKERS